MPTPPVQGQASLLQASTFSDQPPFQPQLPETLDEDANKILHVFQNDWKAAMLRQEVMLTKMLRTQTEIQQDLAAMRSAGKGGDAQMSLQPAAIRIDTCEDAGQHQAANGNGWHMDTEDDGLRKSPTGLRRSGSQDENALSPTDSSITHHESHRAKSLLGIAKKNPIKGFHLHGVSDSGTQSLRHRLNTFLSCREFELMLAVAIVSNALVICMESQYHGLEVGFKLQCPGRLTQANVVWPGADTVFSCLDWFFGVLFLAEFILKFACWKFSYFYDCWNVLDCLFVASFMIDKIADTIWNPMAFRLVRLFRLSRLVRLIRFLDHLEALYVMTTAIGGLTKTLGWAIFLLSVMLLTCDLFLVQLLQATYFSDITASALTEDQLKKHQKMYEYFGTSTRCMLSMFEVTLGNWPPIARLLTEEVSEWFMLLCLIQKVTLGFAVLGVINGVILQETFKVAQTDDLIMVRQKRKTSEALKAKMSKLFQALDSDGDGKVTDVEFLQMCADPDVRIWLSSLDIEADDLPTLFQLCDNDRSGVLTLDELVIRLPRIKGGARSIDLLALLDRDGRRP